MSDVKSKAKLLLIGTAGCVETAMVMQNAHNAKFKRCMSQHLCTCLCYTCAL